MDCSPWCVSRGPWSATGSHTYHGPDCGIFPGPPVSPLIVCTSHKCVGAANHLQPYTPQIFSSRRQLCLHCSMTKKIHCVFRKQRRHCRGGGTGPAGPVLAMAGPLFSDQVINIHKLSLTRWLAVTRVERNVRSDSRSERTRPLKLTLSIQYHQLPSMGRVLPLGRGSIDRSACAYNHRY